jgi:myo-inositol-1(or 4)-monophosphatase
LPVSELGIEPAALIARLAAAAREAGAVAMAKFRSPFKSWNKDNYSPVSEVDIAIDLLLRERLMAIAPRIGWLSEESVDDPARLQARQVWIVDPIDGTRAFIGGREDWTISIALADEGRPFAAALYAPVLDWLYLAFRGGGATLNDKPLRLEAQKSAAPAISAGPRRWIETLGAHVSVSEHPKIHSLALRIAQVSSGELDIAFAGGNSHDWDLAAADLMVHEAGGALTSLRGEAPVYNRSVPRHPPLVAAELERHAQLLALIRDQPRAFA